MDDIYFGRITQTPFTNLNIDTTTMLTGIPFAVTFYISDGVYPDIDVNEPQICLYKTKNDRLIFIEDNTFPISELISKTFVIYTQNDLSFTYNLKDYYFSTLNNGNKVYYEITPPFQPTVRRFRIVSPSEDAQYKVYRYFTSLNYQNINLNNYTPVVINWSSVDFPGGNYSGDPVTLSMYSESGALVVSSIVVTYNTSLPNITFTNIPSGNYFFKYDFMSYLLEEVKTFPLPPLVPRPNGTYTYGNSGSENTPLFSIITQFLQSISATTAFPGGTSTISINVGIGYTGYTYTLSINDVNNFSVRTTFPYYYSSPSINTTVYTATVSNSSEGNDPNTRSTTFTAWKYITSISISNRIIQSSQNYLSWIGGRSTETFNYNGTTITTNGSTTFSVGNKLDSSSFTTGAYPIQPSESIENNGSYSPFYFDSIAPSQNVTVVANTVLQTYTISWTSYYTATSPAPDGTRQYTISFYPTGPGSSYTATSTYNVVTIPYGAVTYGVPYTIAVVDIILTTNHYFFDPPTNVTIEPTYINFPNIIRWTSTTPTLNVIMNDLEFQGTPPTEQNLTEDTSGVTGNISFWAVGSTSSNAIVCGNYDLNANTLFLSLGTIVPIFQGINLPFDFGEYLYLTDEFSLSLYRNGEIVQELESSITIPFTWNPYAYEVEYQPNDQLYFKSNEHLNYGISDPFTFVPNASVTVDQSIYNLDSIILATMEIYVSMPSFYVQLQDVDNLYPPIPIDFLLDDKRFTFNLQDVLLNINVYRLDFFLTSSPSIFISTPSFQVTTPVTVDAYSIYSPVIATLYVDLPTVFEVQLKNVATLDTITLPSFTANLLTHYSFLPSDYGLTDTDYYLIFNPVGLNVILESPSFTLVQTASLSLDQSNYTVVSTIIVMIDLNVDSTIVFSVELQDASNLLAPISLPPFTVNSLSYYSFSPYNYNLSDTGYYFIVRPAGIDIMLQSSVFQMNTNYFTLEPIATPIPEFARATTNTLCVTSKKFNVATIIISVVNNIAYATAITGKPQFLVPCGIVKYLKELNKLLITMNLRDALILLIQKYDIPVSRPAVTNQKRYQYPTVIAKVLKPILQYSSSFRLSVPTTGNPVNTNIEFAEKLSDARVLTICNDDTKTFSTLYTDMIVKAPYWLNTLQPFKKDGDFTYCVVRPINGSLKQIITASISLKNNRLVFTPVILRLVLGFYNAYGPIDIAVMFSSNSIVDILNYLKAAYVKIYLNPSTAL